MPRPRKCRRVCCLPQSSRFGPLSATHCEDHIITMTVEEYETIRLIDLEDFTQEQCAAQMEIARTTVQRIYNDARKKLAQSLVEGSLLKIEGGDYQLCEGQEKICGCGGCHRHKNGLFESNEDKNEHKIKE